MSLKVQDAAWIFLCRLLLHPPGILSGGRESCSIKRRGVGRHLWAVAYTGSPVRHEEYSTLTRSKAPKRIPLSVKELHKAALLARLSGFCYYPSEQLADKLKQEGMKLVTSGSTTFTRYGTILKIKVTKKSRAACLHYMLASHTNAYRPCHLAPELSPMLLQMVCGRWTIEQEVLGKEGSRRRSHRRCSRG